MKNTFTTIAIDFDHTIVEDEYPKIKKLYSNAKRVINRLHNKYFIIIHTCRTGDEEKRVRKYLNDNGILYDAINKNNPLRSQKFGNDSRKVSADIYIDDRALLGLPMKNNEPDWLKIEILVYKWKNFVPST